MRDHLYWKIGYRTNQIKQCAITWAAYSKQSNHSERMARLKEPVSWCPTRASSSISTHSRMLGISKETAKLHRGWENTSWMLNFRSRRWPQTEDEEIREPCNDKIAKSDARLSTTKFSGRDSLSRNNERISELKMNFQEALADPRSRKKSRTPVEQQLVDLTKNWENKSQGRESRSSTADSQPEEMKNRSPPPFQRPALTIRRPIGIPAARNGQIWRAIARNLRPSLST